MLYADLSGSIGDKVLRKLKTGESCKKKKESNETLGYEQWYRPHRMTRRKIRSALAAHTGNPENRDSLNIK